MTKLKHNYIWLSDEYGIHVAVQYCFLLRKILEINKANLEKTISFYKL